MNSNERGLTLVEVLAAIAILSFVGVIIWSVFLQGYKYSQHEVTKNSLLQESNILISNLKNLHQTLNNYQIISTNCTIKVTNLSTTPQQEKVFDNTKICFSILQMNNVLGPGPKTVQPNKNGNDVSLQIKASDKNNPQNSITVDTFLYLMKGADYQ